MSCHVRVRIVLLIHIYMNCTQYIECTLFSECILEWFYCMLAQEPTLAHLREALRTLVSEQQETSLKAACTTSSLNRLNKRLVLFERYLIALSRKGVEPAEEVEGGGGEEEEEEEEKMDRERIREADEDRYMYTFVLICLCACTFEST